MSPSPTSPEAPTPVPPTDPTRRGCCSAVKADGSGVEVEATFTDAAPVAGEAFLRGMSVSVGIPTGPEPVAFSLSLIDLQLPGLTAPTTRTLTLDDLATVGTDLIEFIVGLVRAQVAALSTTDVALAKVRALAGMFGLRDGVTNLPALPLHDIIERGLPALVEWAKVMDDLIAATTTGERPLPDRRPRTVHHHQRRLRRPGPCQSGTVASLLPVESALRAFAAGSDLDGLAGKSWLGTGLNAITLTTPAAGIPAQAYWSRTFTLLPQVPFLSLSSSPCSVPERSAYSPITVQFPAEEHETEFRP